GTLTLEPGIAPLNGLALRVQCFPSYGFLLCAITGHEFLVSTVHLDNGFGQVLVLHQLKQSLARIACIGHDVAGMELTGCEPGLPENVGGADRIMDIAGTYVGGNGKLGLAIYQQMQFVAVGGFFHSLRPSLDRPTSVLIRLHRLATVAPCLERGTVQRHSLPKGRKRLIMLAYHATGDILETGQALGTRQSLEETGES
ncbi:hypothetical protein LCGC14_2341760, partial [marine sediment metagenome]